MVTQNNSGYAIKVGNNSTDAISARIRHTSAKLIPAGGRGVCHALWHRGRCIVSGDNCVEGSPEAIESTYMGQTICGCRCVD